MNGPEIPAGVTGESLKDALSAVYSSAYCALIYVTDPARWPGFAAFAEQHAGHSGVTGEWTENDRAAMRDDARILAAIAGALDPEGE